MKRLMQFIRSDAFWELFLYVVVGVLTTAVNWGMYMLVSRGCAAALGIPPENALLIFIATLIGWVTSVAFAFWANKRYVFHSRDWGRGTLRRELPEFVAARLFSLGFDLAFVELTVHLLGMNDAIAKLVSNIIVIVLNYFASKFWIFKKKS